MRCLAMVAGTLLVCGAALNAQFPFRDGSEAVEMRYARSQPVITYVIRISPGDTAGYDVEMRIRNARDTFRLAMATHPEYDDRYWRFVTGLNVQSPAGSATIARLDSSLWRVTSGGGEVNVRYRLSLPAQVNPNRNAWRPFLTSTGAMVGGPHSFMYVVGEEMAPSHVRVDLPAGWDVATGLTPTNDAAVFFAPTADALIDSPILAGKLRNWRFAVGGVPHRIAYWPRPDATPFDTLAFVAGIEGVTRQAIALFGRAPYRDYTFMIQDGAFGGLEHANTVTMGAPSSSLALDPNALLSQTAHEYFHTWNLVRIRPSEYHGIDYRPGPVTAGIWWVEGVTMFYADLLLRRAGLPTTDSTRIEHLRSSIARYFGTSGNTLLSPEQASRLSNVTTPLAYGDDNPSVHLQGELLGDMLDLLVRDATNGARSLDDVMRLMMERYSGPTGFTGVDIERTVNEVCRCEAHDFFERYVRAPRPIDFDRYLGLIGLRSRVSTDLSASPDPDVRVYAWLPEGARHPRLRVFDRTGAWVRAGLHTGDSLIAVNGVAVSGVPAFRAMLGRTRVGDSLRIEVGRPGGRMTRSFVVPQLSHPAVAIEEVAGATAKQLRLRSAWMAGR